MCKPHKYRPNTASVQPTIVVRTELNPVRRPPAEVMTPGQLAAWWLAANTSPQPRA